MKLNVQRDLEVADLPSIRLDEGRWLLGVEIDKWRRCDEHVNFVLGL